VEREPFQFGGGLKIRPSAEIRTFSLSVVSFYDKTVVISPVDSLGSSG